MTNPEESPLSANETATLWSKADGECTLNGTGATAMDELSQCTDVTFKSPPDTAVRWTSDDFGDLSPGNRTTSIHPPAANVTSNRTITDAHVSIFGVHPSTRLHSQPGDATQYIAPNGTVRGLVDYRVQTPVEQTGENGAIDWGVSDHSVTAVRLRADDDVVARTGGSQQPIVDYDINESGSTTVQLEADIEVQLRGEVSVGSGNTTQNRSIERTYTLTVTDTLEVSVYDLQAYSYEGTYPNGDTALAITQTKPWHGFTLGKDDGTRVRGVWRYFTARNTDWDVLNASTANGTTQHPSDARPVYVHAYPARVGPRAEPIKDGPRIVDTWGPGHASPAPSLHQNVTVGVVNEPYDRTSGLVVRHDAVDRDDIVVTGLVRTVTARPENFAGQETRTIRRSNLTIEHVNTTATSVTLRIELHDARTGDPIVLDNPALGDSSVTPVGVEPRDGFIAVDGQRVRTNASGVAHVTVDESGSYTATYEPDSWRASDPAYVGDRARMKWHPLWTIPGWVQFVTHAIFAFAPFLLALYAGYRINAFFQIPDYP